jgi:hypothetical protein
MAEAVSYRQWVQGSGHQQALRAYNDWVFGPNPVFNKGDPNLFIHGEINSPAVRQEAATIDTNTLIVVHVVGANFIIGDKDSSNNDVDADPKVSAACQFSARNEDRKVSVEFKGQADPNWTNLTDLVTEASYPPSNFTASPQNPYLGKWDVPMPSGNQRGSWASKLLLLKVPPAGRGKVFELKSHGTGIQPYQQKTHFEISVE